MTIQPRKLLTACLGVVAALGLCGCPGTQIRPPEPARTAQMQELNVLDRKPEEVRKELLLLQKEQTTSYTIAAGDKFDFKVYDNEELNATGLQVTPDGLVSVGLIGPIKIGGLTLQQATNSIQNALKEYITNPKVTLIPTEIHSSTFSIVGKVGNPGSYPIRNNTRLTDAIAMAKGFAVGEFKGDTIEMADLRHAFIARNGTILPVDFIEAIRKGNQLHNIPLRDGDYIYIPSTMNREVFILGDVKSPGYIGYKENLTLMQALTYVGGTLDSSDFNAVIIRGGLATPKVYKVYTEDILRGKTRDVLLEPSDIVYVPKGDFSEYNVFIKKIIPTLEVLNLIAGPFGHSTFMQPSSNN